MTNEHHHLDGECRLPAGLVVREVEDEILVLDTKADQVHQLNRSASLIWRLYGKGASVEEVADRLTAEFEVNRETAQKDADETVSRLRALSLIG